MLEQFVNFVNTLPHEKMFVLLKTIGKSLESTNSRVLYLSIFSMLCLLSLAIWQVLYLRRYFKAKKLIE